MAAPILVELKASLGNLTSKLGEAESEIEGLSARGAGNFEKLAAAGGGIALGVGLAGAAIGAFSIKMASDYEDAQAKFDQSMQNAGLSTEQYAGQTKDLEGRLEKLGFTHTQVEEAMARGITSTQNYDRATRNVALAADLAAARNIDLATAQDAVDKAATGNLRAIRALGIDIPVAASSAEKLSVATDNLAQKQSALNDFLAANPEAVDASSKKHAEYERLLNSVGNAQKKMNEQGSASDEILSTLQQRLGGQAAAASETFSGKVKVLEAKIQDLATSIGLKLIPIVEHLADWLGKTGEWLGKHKELAETLAVVVGGALVIAVGAYTVSMISAAAATIAAAAPVIAIVAGLGLMVAAIIYLWTHWDQVWNWIKGHPAIAAVIAIIAGPLIGTILGIVAVVKIVSQHWTEIWNVIHTVAMWAWDNVLHPLFAAISWYITNLVVPGFLILSDIVSTAFGVIASVVGWAWDNVIQPIWRAIQVYITGVLIPEFNVLWDIVQNVWTWIGDAIGAAWGGVIEPVFTRISEWVQTQLVPAMSHLWATAQNVWSGIAKVVSWAWDNVIQPIWRAIQVVITNVLIPTFNVLSDIVQNVWSGIVSGATWLWQMLQPIFSFIGDVITTVVVPVLSQLWATAQIVFSGIAAVAGWLWDNILYPVFSSIASTIKEFILPSFTTWRDTVSSVFSFIGMIAMWLWNNVLQPIFSFIGDVISNVLIPTFQFLWGVVSTVWGDISQVISWAWNNVIQPIWNSILFVVGVMKAVFNDLKGVFETVWNGISSVISTVWDDIKPIIDAITSAFGTVKDIVGGGLDGIASVAHTLNVPGFAVGTSFAPAGWSWVGERGPELMRLPAGAQVADHQQSLGMASGGGTSHEQLVAAFSEAMQAAGGGGRPIELHSHGVTNESDLARRQVSELMWQLKTA
jgi:phage-related protein